MPKNLTRTYSYKIGIGDTVEIKTLMPGETISGTYTAILNDGDDPDEVYYNLKKAFSQTLEGSTVEIPVIFEDVLLYVSGNPSDNPRFDFYDGLDLATGANITKVPLMNIFGVNDIPFTLRNNSMHKEKGLFSEGWSSNYDLAVKPQLDGSVNVHFSPTSYVRFINNNATKGIVNGSIKDGKINLNLTETFGTYKCITTNYERYKLEKKTDGYILTDNYDNLYYFDVKGKLYQTKDKKGRTLEIENDDNKLTVVEPSTNKSIITTIENGLVKKVMDSTGRTAKITYNDKGLLETITNATGDKTRYEYDNENCISSESINNGDVLKIAYDNLNRVVQKTDEALETTTYSHDDKSEFWRSITTITDRNGNVEKIKSDYRGQVVSVQNAMEETTYFSYNKYGDNTSIRDAEGNSTMYTFDQAGNVLQVEDAEGITETMTYDSHYNMLTHEMENGSKTINTYNNNNLLLTTTNERGVTTSFTYNDDGQPLTSTTEGLGVSSYSYSSGRPVSQKDTLGNETRSEYDGTGKRIKSIDALGNVTSYEYDASGRLLSTTSAGGVKLS